MAKGGYRVFDAKMARADYNNPGKATGLYDFIESTHGKPILLLNVEIPQDKVISGYVTFVPIGTLFQGIFSVVSSGNAVLKLGVDQEDNFYSASIGSPLPPASSAGSPDSEEPTVSM